MVTGIGGFEAFMATPSDLRRIPPDCGRPADMKRPPKYRSNHHGRTVALGQPGHGVIAGKVAQTFCRRGARGGRLLVGLVPVIGSTRFVDWAESARRHDRRTCVMVVSRWNDVDA